MNNYLELIEKGLVDESDITLCYLIGKAFIWGNCGLPKDITKSLYYLEVSANAGCNEARYELGEIYYYGFDIDKDIEKAEYWYTLAANEGYVEAQHSLGYVFDCKEDHEQSLAWFLRAADQGYVESQVKLGSIYYFREEDYDKAVYWFSKAANEYDINAIYYLANCYLYGHGCEKDIEQAIDLYKEAVSMGCSRSAFQIAQIYYYGEDGVEKNTKKAKYWYRKAVDLGDAYAQEMLEELEDT